MELQDRLNLFLSFFRGKDRRFYMNALLLIMTMGFVASIFYFSWMPDPAMRDQVWLPRWVRVWADKYDQLRTGVPLVPLGFIGGLYLGIKRSPLPHWLMLWCGLSNLVLLAEVGQIFLPRRRFDLMDVMWGSVGAGAGVLSAGWLFYRTWKRLNGDSQKRRVTEVFI